MKRTVLVHWVLIGCIVLVGLTGISARAGEPAAKPKGDAQAEPPAEAPAKLPEPVMPERKLEFEVSEEPYPVRVMAVSLADPQTRELRHVAVVRLNVPIVPRSIDAFVPRQSDYPPRRTSVNITSPDQVVLYLNTHSYRESVLKQMPEEERPATDVLSDLERAFLHVNVEDSTVTEDATVLGPWTVQSRMSVSICAPTAERAEELVHGLFAMLDYGLCYPTQRQWLLKKPSAEQELADRRAKLAEEQAKVAQLEKEYEKLDEFKDLDKATLSGLVTQQRLITVDIAGAKAQIEACNGLLKRSPHEEAIYRVREEIETLKITAEIELVGLTARKNAIDQIVQNGQRRAALGSEMSQAHNRMRRYSELEVSELERAVAIYEALRKAYEPFPVRGKITIHPIKWEVIEGEEAK
jgi:hypothetical protein